MLIRNLTAVVLQRAEAFFTWYGQASRGYALGQSQLVARLQPPEISSAEVWQQAADELKAALDAMERAD